MLMLDTGSGQVRVSLPKEWTLGTDVVGRASLFNRIFAGAGQNVTVRVLESNLFSNTNFSINMMLGMRQSMQQPLTLTPYYPSTYGLPAKLSPLF